MPKYSGTFKIKYENDNDEITFRIIEENDEKIEGTILSGAELVELTYKTPINNIFILKHGEKVLVIEKNIKDEEENEVKQKKYEYNHYLYDYIPKKFNANDENSRGIIALEDMDENAIKKYSQDLYEYIIKNKLKDESGEDYTICVIPRHSANGKNYSGTSFLAKIISKKLDITDGSQVIIRKIDVPSKKKTNERDEKKEKQSIEVKEIDKIKDHIIFLIDDVITTGTSMKVNKKILLWHGAKKVICIGIGRTVKYYE